ncbi:MAG: uroporphyrinogen-III C-methyltransferase [Alphaproteobacteria bacterium]|nr:uroporphyrinogen-III C-methyltransferase [Alphaproteobacteria bacterium]|tara:strand:- start:25 stop:879 length:855 start_codon:yes stop_codon:yes gene_type:complete
MKNIALNINTQDHPNFETGTVWLVGAGPGDPGLLTIRALYSLQVADTVIYDALVSKSILENVKPGATLEYAGKRGGKKSSKQPDITKRLIEEAQKGKRVVRLKGGDPFMFGRGGEEALALAAAKIPFVLIPGVTASVGGLASSGIPLTHRTTGSAVTFLTGHSAGGKLPNDLNWNAIASGAPTLIFYMAIAHLESIANKLLNQGIKGDTPTALIANATLKNQHIIVTSLEELVKDAEKEKIVAPAILVIGNIVELRRALDPNSSIEERYKAARKITSHWHQTPC